MSKRIRKTTSQFSNEVKELDPDYTLIGEYTGARNYTQIKHNVCGSIYDVRPSQFISGGGRCKKCSDGGRLSLEEVINNINRIHDGTIRLITEYQGYQHDIKVKCTKCNYKWITSYERLLRHKCPNCNQLSRNNIPDLKSKFSKYYKIMNDDNTIISRDSTLELIHLNCNSYITLKVSTLLRKDKDHSKCKYCKHLSDDNKSDHITINQYVNINILKEIYNHINSIIECTMDDHYPLSEIGDTVDIFIPSKLIAINIIHHDNVNYNKNYHLNKTNICESKGIHLIHIFEDEWLNQQEIIKDRLLHILGLKTNKIYARKCELREIDSSTSREFLDKYHLQGNVNSPIRVGLYHEDELVGVGTFGWSRFEPDTLELFRYATVTGIVLIGGLGKIINYFISHYEVTKLTTYADRRFSTTLDTVYSNFFTEISITPPKYWYVKSNIRYSRYKFQKHKLKDLPNYDQSKTEYQIMSEMGFDRIWDCGNIKYQVEYLP